MERDSLKVMIDEVLAGAGYDIGGRKSDTGTQVEGSVLDVKGKNEAADGNRKDAVLDAVNSPSESPEAGEEATSKHREAALAGDGNILQYD